MTTIADQLKMLIDDYLPGLNSLNEQEITTKPSPAKWSKKEVIGHLIDSAQNNIRRFIVAGYEANPTIVYKQDKWVAINNYQQWDPKELVQLWYLLNRQMVYVLKNIPGDAGQRICNTGTSYPIECLAQDYIKHLKHHMHPVLNREPVPYP
jgi:hypothetical protein